MRLISVIVPVYNVRAYLPACLDSLLSQTYEALEIVLVDDGSTDGSAALCDEYAARDPRVRVVHQPNAGVSAARNAGLAAASGELIGFADGDDWAEPTLFERLERALREADAQAAMCGYIEYLPGPERPKLLRCPPRAGAAEEREALYWALTRGGYFTAVWNKLFRRELIWQNGQALAFDPTLAIGEDETWLLRALCRARRVALDPEALYHWRCRMESATREDTITPGRMSILRAKQLAVTLVRPYGARLTRLARARLLNDCYFLRVLAYRARDGEAARTLTRAFRPVFGAWLFSDDVPLLRKLKVLALGALIRCRAPVRWVDRAYDFKRSYAR